MGVLGISLMMLAVVVIMIGLALVHSSEERRRSKIAKRGRSHWDVHDGDDYGHMDLDIDVVRIGEDS